MHPHHTDRPYTVFGHCAHVYVKTLSYDLDDTRTFVYTRNLKINWNFFTWSFLFEPRPDFLEMFMIESCCPAHSKYNNLLLTFQKTEWWSQWCRTTAKNQKVRRVLAKFCWNRHKLEKNIDFRRVFGDFIDFFSVLGVFGVPLRRPCLTLKSSCSLSLIFNLYQF